MTTDGILYIVAVVLLLGATAILLRRGPVRKAKEPGSPEFPAQFFAVHSRYFPQLRRVLSQEDTRYMAQRASSIVFRRWKKSVRRAGCQYLEGLREDFARLHRLARLLALYSPKVQPRQELELARLNLQFQMLYGIVWWRFWLGRPAEERLGQMAVLIGRLGNRLEQASLALGAAPGGLTP